VNKDLKWAMFEAGLKQWEVAKRYGLNEGNFSRLLREELPKEKKDRVLAIIDELKQERESVAR
jgi:hypothetical protein